METERLLTCKRGQNHCHTLLFVIPAISISICSLTVTVILSLAYANIRNGLENITIYLDLE